jgi:hypothetical protein
VAAWLAVAKLAAVLFFGLMGVLLIGVLKGVVMFW